MFIAFSQAVMCDVAAFAQFAGVRDYRPRLKNAKRPTLPKGENNLFAVLLDAELRGTPLLLQQAAWLGAGDEAQLETYECAQMLLRLANASAAVLRLRITGTEPGAPRSPSRAIKSSLAPACGAHSGCCETSSTVK